MERLGRLAAFAAFAALTLTACSGETLTDETAADMCLTYWKNNAEQVVQENTKSHIDYVSTDWEDVEPMALEVSPYKWVATVGVKHEVIRDDAVKPVEVGWFHTCEISGETTKDATLEPGWEILDDKYIQ